MVKQLKRRIFIFFLIIFLVQSCLDPTQKDGRCTKCLSTENLQNGSCYIKIRGCFKQSATTCTQCQDGYVISNNQCTRYAEYFKIMSLAPSIIKIQNPRLNSSQITNGFVGGYQETTNLNTPSYAQAKFTLIKEYPVLTTLKVYKVEEQIVNGVNYLFYIINTENYDLYLAKVYVSLQLQGSVTEIYKNDVGILKNSTPSQANHPIPGSWREFTFFNDQGYIQSLDLVQKTFSGLETYNLQRVEYQVVAGINYLFYYKSPNSQSFTCQVYVPFYGPPLVKTFWGSKPTAINSKTTEQSPAPGSIELIQVTEYDKEPFFSVVKTIQKMFPKFAIPQIKKAHRQVVAGQNFIVTFSLPNSSDIYDVQVFIPLSYTGKPPEIQSVKKNGATYNPSGDILSGQNEIQSPNVSPIVIGGYSDVTNLKSPFYLQAKTMLFKVYPELSILTLIKAQEQIVNGVNYIFYFMNQQNGDQYMAQIYVSLSMTVTIKKVSKNDKEINQDTSTTLPGSWQDFTDLKDQRLMSAQKVVLSKYPELKDYNLNNVKSQIVSGINFRLVFVHKQTNEKFVAQVHCPFNGQPQITKTGGIINGTEPTTTGGRQVLQSNDYKIEPYLSAKRAIQNIFLDFSDSMVKKAEKQVVAGSNLYITFLYPKSADTYEVAVFVPLPYTGNPELTSIKKNGVQFETQTPIQDSPTESETEVVAGGYSSQVDESDSFFLISKPTLFKKYPFLSGFQIKKIQEQMVSGKNYRFTMVDPKTNDQYVARVYVNLKKEASVQEISKNGVSIKKETESTDVDNTEKNQTPSVDDLLAGGWQAVSASELTSDSSSSVQAAILKSYPTFTPSLIKKIAKQVVSGQNYAISFSLPNSTDLYEVKVYLPLSYTEKGPTITETKKNGITYDLNQKTPTKIEPTFNYQSDQTFTQLYKFFKSETKISNLLPIAEVTRELKIVPSSSKTFYEYKITYSRDEYAICRFYPEFGLYEVVSYMADKNEIYNLAARMNIQPYCRSQNILAEKIKYYNPQKFSRALIRDISQVKLSERYRIYIVNIYTSSGQYNITILDRGELFVILVQQIDSQQGFAIRTNAPVQYRQEYIIEQIKIFFFSKYSLSGYELTLALVNARDGLTNQYVILLSRNDLKKIRVSVQETNGTFIIKKQDLLANGIYVISDPLVQKNLDDQARKDFSTDLNAFDRVLVLTNGTFNVLRYANSFSLSTYTKNLLTKKNDLKNKLFSKSQPCQIPKIGTICTKCSDSGILWKGKCFTKVQNCAFQVASECLACNKFSIEIKGKCINDYSVDIFA